MRVIVKTGVTDGVWSVYGREHGYRLYFLGYLANTPRHAFKFFGSELVSEQIDNIKANTLDDAVGMLQRLFDGLEDPIPQPVRIVCNNTLTRYPVH